jgi:hypothetical protein
VEDGGFGTTGPGGQIVACQCARARLRCRYGGWLGHAFSCRSPVLIARSAAFVPPVAEATVPPAPFLHITCISPVSWPAGRARPAGPKLLTWRFSARGAAPPAPAREQRAGGRRRVRGQVLPGFDRRLKRHIRRRRLTPVNVPGRPRPPRVAPVIPGDPGGRNGGRGAPGHGGGHWQLRLPHPARVSRSPGRRPMVWAGGRCDGRGPDTASRLTGPRGHAGADGFSVPQGTAGWR